MDSLIAQFQRLAMPSRSSQLPAEFTTLSPEQVEALHDRVRAIEDAEHKSVQYRKLREILLMNAVPSPIATPIYEASAEHCLQTHAWPEFSAVANVLLSLHRPSTCPPDTWVYSALLIYYGITPETWQDFCSLLYGHHHCGDKDLGIAPPLPSHLLDCIALVVAVKTGNLVRLRYLLPRFHPPLHHMVSLLIATTRGVLEPSLLKAYRQMPQKFLDRLLVEASDPAKDRGSREGDDTPHRPA